MPDPQLIQVKKYPNRRLYDQTRSRHLTNEELYDLVVAGHTVSVTDSKTGVDITNLVLVQALAERGPEKFASFPPEVLHLMIRASEQMLRGFASTWFSQMMKGMGPMGAGVGAAMPGMAWPPATGFGWPTGGAPMTNPFMPTPPPTVAMDPTSIPKPPAAPTDAVADLRARLDAIMQEVAKLHAAPPKPD